MQITEIFTVVEILLTNYSVLKVEGKSPVTLWPEFPLRLDTCTALAWSLV